MLKISEETSSEESIEKKIKELKDPRMRKVRQKKHLDSESDDEPQNKKIKTENKTKTLQDGKDNLRTTNLLQVSNGLTELLTHQQSQMDDVKKDHNQTIENGERKEIVCNTGTQT